MWLSLGTQSTPSSSSPEVPRVSRIGIWVLMAIMAACVIALTVWAVVGWEGFRKQAYFWIVFLIVDYIAIAWIISNIFLQSDVTL